MKQEIIIAIPTVNNKLTSHFGHCEKFAIIRVKEKRLVSEGYCLPPPHRPGIYPAFLASLGVNVVISSRMGQRAAEMFREKKIEVCIGIASGQPRQLVRDYLEGRLEKGHVACDH